MTATRALVRSADVAKVRLHIVVGMDRVRLKDRRATDRNWFQYFLSFLEPVSLIDLFPATPAMSKYDGEVIKWRKTVPLSVDIK